MAKRNFHLESPLKRNSLYFPNGKGNFLKRKIIIPMGSLACFIMPAVIYQHNVGVAGCLHKSCQKVRSSHNVWVLLVGGGGGAEKGGRECGFTPMMHSYGRCCHVGGRSGEGASIGSSLFQHACCHLLTHPGQPTQFIPEVGEVLISAGEGGRVGELP